MPLVLNRNIPCRAPSLSFHPGFSITPMSTSAYIASIRRTLPEILRSRFLELCSDYDGFHGIYTERAVIELQRLLLPNTLLKWFGYQIKRTFSEPNYMQLECGPMPNVMAALPNIGGALCPTPQNLADAHY